MFKLILLELRLLVPYDPYESPYPSVSRGFRTPYPNLKLYDSVFCLSHGSGVLSNGFKDSRAATAGLGFGTF